jgi:hypothetical protein
MGMCDTGTGESVWRIRRFKECWVRVDCERVGAEMGDVVWCVLLGRRPAMGMKVLEWIGS